MASDRSPQEQLARAVRTHWVRPQSVGQSSQPDRPGLTDRRVPGIVIATWLLSVAALLGLSTVGGSVHSVALTTDSAPLAVAGGPAPAVVGYVGVGQAHVYVPWTVVPTVAVGELVALANSRRRIAVGLALGVAAAGQLLVVSGCGCGGGAVRSLAAALPGVPG